MSTQLGGFDGLMSRIQKLKSVISIEATEKLVHRIRNDKMVNTTRVFFFFISEHVKLREP